MKAATTKRKPLGYIRYWVSSLLVIAVVLVVPVFSIFEFGHFFHGTDSRSSAQLPIMTQRPVDTTALPAQLFQEPLITVTFDDGFESIYKAAMPLLQKYGIHTTQYVLAGKTDDPTYVSMKQIGEMQRGGHEIACHTMTHPNLTQDSDADMDYQLRQCKAILSQHFGTISNFASPYGANDARTYAAISKYFDSQRNTNGDPTNGVDDADVNEASNFTRFNIIGVTVHHDTTIKELQQLVDYAKATNGWLVLTYHQADDASNSQYGVEPVVLDQQLAFLSKTNVRIVTMREAMRATQLQNVEY